MNTRNTQMGFPQEPTESEEAAGFNGHDAPADDATASHVPELEPSTSASDPFPPRESPPIAAASDFPVASILPPVAPLLHPAPLTPLEERLIRLEAELSQLRGVAPPVPGQQVQLHAPDASRKSAAFWSDIGKRLLTPSGPAAAPPPRHEALASMIPSGVRRTWIILDVITELRAMYCMFFDPRYRLSWVGRLAPLILVALIFSSWLWMPFAGITGLGWVVVKIGDMVLAFVLFKLLSYEARRYRETAPDLPPSLRQ